MRVAFITHYTELYGANRSLLNLIDGLKIYDVVSHVIAPAEGDVTKALRDRGVPVAIIPLKLWVAGSIGGFNIRHPIKWLYKFRLQQRDSFRRLYRNFRVLPTIVRKMKSWNIDVVYTNTSVTPVGAIVAWIIRRPHIWHIREFGDLDYGVYYDWGRNISIYLISRADAQIAISEAIRAHYLKDARSNRMYAIYNGVASDAEFNRLYKIADSYNILKIGRRYTFALVGLIHPAKSQDVAIRALALLGNNIPKVNLLIVGEGDKSHLEILVRKLGVAGSVEFWGYVDDPYKAYLDSDAVLICSKNEAMGRVTVEAMSACRPVIGYENAGTSEIVEHEHTGLLYREGPEELAACMLRFIENPAWAKQLGINGWYVARKKYTIENYAKEVYDVLQSICPIHYR